MKLQLSGSGERVFVLVHGAPGDATQMRPLAPHLEVHGRVALVDLPDLASDDPDDLVPQLQAAVESFAPSPVVLVGLSFGAWLVARVAGGRPPSNLAKLVLISGFARHPEKDVAPFESMASELEAGRLVPSALVDVALSRWVPSGGNAALVEHVTALLSSIDASRCARDLRRLIGTARSERTAEPSAISASIIHARDDVAIPLEFGEQLHARLPRSQLRVIDTDSHYLTWTHAAECAAIAGAA